MLEFDGLRKSYGTNQVLDDVGFAVQPGSMFRFCGSNGAGKTTTMRIAMGLVVPDAGEVRWQGRPLDQRTRRRVGYMPEERGLYPKMKVGEQITYFARLHGLDAAAAARGLGDRGRRRDHAGGDRRSRPDRRADLRRRTAAHQRQDEAPRGAEGRARLTGWPLGTRGSRAAWVCNWATR